MSKTTITDPRYCTYEPDDLREKIAYKLRCFGNTIAPDFEGRLNKLTDEIISLIKGHSDRRFGERRIKQIIMIPGHTTIRKGDRRARL